MEITNSERRYAAQYARQHAAYEKKVKPIFYAALRKSVLPVLDSLDPNDVRGDVWMEAYKHVYITVGVQAAQREYIYQRQQNPIKEDLIADFFNELFRMAMTQYGQEVAFAFSADLTGTTRDQISKALEFAAENNYTRRQTARLIYEYTLGQIGRDRALVIARTETTTAASLGKKEGAKTYFKEIGDTSGGYKLWITRLDGKERHDHHITNGQAVRMDDRFDVGGYDADIPGDTSLPAKERVRCRCTFVGFSERQYRRRAGQL